MIFWFFLFLIILLFGLKILFWIQKDRSKTVIGFFHPFCNDGGGGERVLWVAINGLYEKFDANKMDVEIVVYSGPMSVSEPIKDLVKKQFGVQLIREPKFVTLHHRWLVEEKTWPVARILGQSFGSIFLGLEAMLRFTPTVVVDSMGYAFTYPLFLYLAGCPVGCYVHYPTMSTDMIDKVSNPIKLFYYRLFHKIYGIAGSCASVVMVNSSWTLGHIRTLWPQDQILTVFPPCDTTQFEKIPFQPRQEIVLSIAQFRPEKDHVLQIKSFARFLQLVPQSKAKLVLVGSCRKNNLDDEKRLEDLRNLAKQLKIDSAVLFKVGIPHSEKTELLKVATVGLHTMWNEHFGISVVEFMAAGAIPLAHKSGGPKADIVQTDESKGFLADSEEEYAQKLKLIFEKSNEERLIIQKAARIHASRFSDDHFQQQFFDALCPKLLKIKTKTG